MFERALVSARPRRALRGLAVCLVGSALLLAVPPLAADPKPVTVTDVSLSRPFFNPSLGQKIGISFSLAQPGNLTLQILDRDGYPVRKLVSGKAVEKGKQALDWDGRDDAGEVVPDEAYSFKIDVASGGKVDTYFPAAAPAEDVKAETNYYDRRGATLSYKLPRPSRVHVQAGTATTNPSTKKPEGPVLKTLVNREPRPAGAVVEHWSGFDEGGTFNVPDLPNFVVSIAATSLPENAILVTGNRKLTFLEWAASRSNASLLPARSADHSHHRGLSALDDAAPTLKAVPLNAVWSAAEKVWRPEGKSMTVSLKLHGPSAGAFERQPTAVYVFVDKARAVVVRRPHDGDTLSIPLGKLTPKPHVIAINWASSYGPVAIDTFRVTLGKPASLQPAAFK
jgi:hypothetical protein